MRNTLIVGALIALAGAAQAQTVIYDTFNEADQANLFDCCSYVPINSATSQAGTLAIAAVPFIAAADGKIGEVDVALSAIDDSFNAGVEVQVMNGEVTPSMRKQRFYNASLPAFGQCCAFVSDLADKGVKIKAGHRYWIMVKALGNVEAAWNVNSMALSGPYAVKVGAARNWTITEGPLPAVRVITK